MLEPGQTFASRYRVIRRIAEGGMGAIFEAEHTATERRVALKLLFPHIMSVASARKKFELEAKISARVNSPNIVEVLDAGFDEASKSPFLVMELLEGHTLSHYVREHGALGIDQALPLLSQVAAGLDAAHGYKESNGALKPIVHRDLKPENLFMAREHGAHVVKILDFGIAKVLGETGNISQEVRGTPLYMAFEQVTAGPLSPQTDVWALGLIAYYTLTASHYWRSANQPSANVQSLFAEILTLPLEAPSVRLRQQNVRVSLPPAFDSWLLECIQREPARRFPSAGAAIDALALAFGRSPRVRRDSRPAAGFALASTQAYEPTAKTPSKPPLGTAASLPGMATERASAAAPARPEGRARSWMPAAAAGGAVLLGGLVWLTSGGDEPGVVPGGEPHAVSAASGAPSAASGAPSASGAAATGAAAGSAAEGADPSAHRPSIAPVAPAPSIAPAVGAGADAPGLSPASGDVASSADLGASGDAPVNADPAEARAGSSDPSAMAPSAANGSAGATPQVRVAPREDPGATAGGSRSAPAPAPANAPATSSPAHAAPLVRAGVSAPASRSSAASAPGRSSSPGGSTSSSSSSPSNSSSPPPKKTPRSSDAYKMR